MSLLDIQYFSRQPGKRTPIKKLAGRAEYTITGLEEVIFIDTSKVSVKVYLPKPGAVQTGSGFSIKDSTGNAGINNIFIICRSDSRHPKHSVGEETLDGMTSITLDHNYAGVSIISDGVNWLLSP